MEREEKQREVTKQSVYDFMQPSSPGGMVGDLRLAGSFTTANAMFMPVSNKPMYGLLDEMKELSRMAEDLQDALAYILSNMVPTLMPAEPPRTTPTIESDGMVGDYFRVIADIRTKMEYNLTIINALVGLLCGTQDERNK